MKPLFIPLKREYFEAFNNHTKHTEYRIYGPRWNERTCAVGREVVLSLGYGKRHRLLGVISAFAQDSLITKLESWKACFGNHRGPAACITIRVYAEVKA